VTAVDDALYAAYYQPLGSSNPPTFRTVVLKIGEVIVDDVTGVHNLRWDYEERLQMREFLPEDGSVLSSAISATEDYIYVAMGIPWDETSESCIRLIKTTHPRLVSPGEDVPYSVEMPWVPDGVDGEQIAVVSDPNSEDVCLLFSDSGGVQLLFSATGGEYWAAPLLLAQADPESSQQIRLDLKFEPQTGLIHAVAIVDRGVRYWAYDSEIEEVVTESLIEDLNSSASVGMVCRENKGCTRGLDVPQPSIFVGADGTVFVSYGIGEGTGAVKIARKSARNMV
jgi:hypothetical protein